MLLSRLSLPHSLLVLAAGLACCLNSVRGQAGSTAGKMRCSPAMPPVGEPRLSLSLSLFSLSSLGSLSHSLALLHSPHYNCRLEPGAAVSGRP